MNINLHEGVFCNYDREEQVYLPDFSVTVVKEAAEGETEEWNRLYYEQDGFVITLANYLYGKMEISRIEQLSCSIRISGIKPET